jgi:hypothetical protein
MPVTIPSIDDRRYQALLDETLARIPVHNPEWTNFNRSDPGVTLVELFAFLTESLLYRANQIPERNRRKFLTLLGVPLQPGSSASGLVAFTNERGPLETFTLSEGFEVRAGEVPFRTTRSIDVLPIEATVYYKRERTDAPEELKEYYRQLYSSFRDQPAPPELRLYDTVAFQADGTAAVDLATTVDRSLWIALLFRQGDRADKDALKKARSAIARKTLSLGLVPALSDALRDVRVAAPAQATPRIQYQFPKVEGVGRVPANLVPEYRAIDADPSGDILTVPGVVQLALPAEGDLRVWTLDPLEAGVADLPPVIDDASDERLITWIRVRLEGGGSAKFLWAGINATLVEQRTRVLNEVLPDGTGEPDQVVRLAQPPVITGTVQVSVAGSPAPWQEIDDLFAAGPEVPSPDSAKPPGAPPLPGGPIDVFTLDPEAGELHFGDGFRGRRPPAGAAMRASYEYAVGALGNVGPSLINSGPAIPAGVKVTNPVRTWGGSASEPVSSGEKQVARYLQHRNRLVTAEDFRTITLRTPGVDIGRVDVLPAFNPRLNQDEPGGAPGAVTLLVIPRHDSQQPEAPRPDALFLNAICRHLDPKRLITTELFLRGPVYQPIWISIGIRPKPGIAFPRVREAVRRTLLDFLSPLEQGGFDAWPLRKPVVDRELMAVASRVDDVMLVTNVIVAKGANPPAATIAMEGLDLPRVMNIGVADGDPADLSVLRGAPTPAAERPTQSFVPVPTIPEEC